MNQDQNKVKVTNEPIDRLTALCGVMNEALEEALAAEEKAGLTAEDSDVRGIIFLLDGDLGGIEVFGYDGDSNAALVDLLVHLRAMFRSMGKEMKVMSNDGQVLL